MSSKWKESPDIKDGLFFIVMGMGALILAFDFHIPGSVAMSPSLFPVIASGCLIAFGANLAYRGAKQEPKRDALSSGEVVAKIKTVGSVFLLCLLYALAMSLIGFLISTVLYLFLFLLLLEERGKKMIFLLPLITSVTIYLFFGKALSVFLP